MTLSFKIIGTICLVFVLVIFLMNAQSVGKKRLELGKALQTEAVTVNAAEKFSRKAHSLDPDSLPKYDTTKIKAIHNVLSNGFIKVVINDNISSSASILQTSFSYDPVHKGSLLPIAEQRSIWFGTVSGTGEMYRQKGQPATNTSDSTCMYFTLNVTATNYLTSNTVQYNYNYSVMYNYHTQLAQVEKVFIHY